MGSEKSKLPKEDEQYLLQKTKFNRKQIRKWYASFMRDCPTGQLNRTIFLNMYSQFFPDGKAKAFYEHLFRTFDRDNSGQIDFKEFLSAINVTKNGTPADKLELAFELYDINGNGSIEESEMVEIIKAIYMMVGETICSENNPRRRTQHIFERMDANHDGVLTKEEFIRGCLNDPQLYKLLACPDAK